MACPPPAGPPGAAILDDYGVASQEPRTAIDRLAGVPVDIRPVYPQADELVPDG